ncbi:MAG: glutaredoxin family protein [Nanoarchaeota archaeon]
MTKKVIVYTSPVCMECEKAKKFFKDKNIEFEEIDTFENPKKAKELFEKTKVRRIPMIQIDDEILAGFDEKKINEVLEK